MPGQPDYDPSIPVLAVPRMAQVETLLNLMIIGHPYRASTLARMMGCTLARARPIIKHALEWTDSLKRIPAPSRRTQSDVLFVRVR